MVLGTFKKHIEEVFPELMEHPFLLACSGGIDSIVLSHLCQRNGMNFLLAHCNFNLRGLESDGDEDFVREFARKIERDLVVKHFGTMDYALLNKVSVQMSARELRYQWFSKLIEKKALKTIVTAHHSDDNLETFLINLSRGTGIDGLLGIPSKTPTLARPLLLFSRTEIEAYAIENGLQWREDSSNAETKYLRNKIRQEIVPRLKELHPTFLSNFAHTQDYLKQTSALSQEYGKALKERLFKEGDNGIAIAIAPLLQLTPLKAHLYNLFQEYGFKEWDDVAHLLTAMSGKEVVSKTHRLLKDREYLFLQERILVKPQRYLIHEKDVEVSLPIPLKVDEVDALQEKSNNVLYVPKEKLKYPLTVRKWEKGDYFYPFGMRGVKKLSKFFKDEKMSQIQKEAQWLLCSEGAIVWIMGKRSDHRFKVTDKTKRIVKFTILE
ncbi:tRNA lysidine(34) synthetase TilS [Spongiimicrobium salis]|uniref:tRNA lysidine(34) synthetase TilS n=1 Tax=Spongiimicrobium salis TaxID=1667022 RepID=UPI00374D8F2D